jgi:hypothetical protein
MVSKLRVNGNKNICHDKIKAKIGMTDKNNHSVFYLEGGAFITPSDEYEDFEEIMDYIEHSCRNLLKKKLLKSTTLETNFLMNFEVCADRMKKNKNTYLSFQYHFKQKNENNISIVTLKENNENFFVSLLDDIENELSRYNMRVSKTR